MDVNFDGEAEAAEIENRAAERSYDRGFGVGEWEAFLSPEESSRLIELGDQGFGTWGREPKTLEDMKRIKSS